MFLVDGSVNFTLLAFDPSSIDELSGFTFEIDWDGDGSVDQIFVGPSGSVVPHTFNSTGNYTIRVTATDKDGSVSDPVEHVIDIEAGTLISVGGPYTGAEGSPVSLSATISTPFEFVEWDFDNDGQFDDAVGTDVFFTPGDNGTFPIAVRAYGADVGEHFASTSVVAYNVAPAVNISGPAEIDAGETVTFFLFASDPSPVDRNGTFNYEIDWEGDGTVDITLQASWATVIQHVYESGGTFDFTITITDKDGGTSQEIHTISVDGIEPPPVADAGGLYSGNEGTIIGLSAAGSTGTIALYEWDLDNDGQYDDAVGASTDFAADDNGVFTIGLRVTGPGGASTGSATVTVNNLAPTAAITGTTEIYRGETVTFNLNAIDASPVDQAGLFDFEIDWDGNGTIDETLLGVPTGTTVQHTFPAVAANNIQVRRDGQRRFDRWFQSVTSRRLHSCAPRRRVRQDRPHLGWYRSAGRGLRPWRGSAAIVCAVRRLAVCQSP